MSTTAQLVGRVRYKAGLQSIQAVANEDIVAHLNRGQEFLMWGLHVSAMPEMSELASGTLTNSRVGLPADFGFEQLVEVGSTLKTARPVAPSQLDQLSNIPQHAPSATQPWYYIWHNATDNARRLHIEIGAPASTAAYELRYIQSPTDIDLVSSNPEWRERYNDLLVDFAVSRLLDGEGNRAAGRRIFFSVVARMTEINQRWIESQRKYELTPSFG